MAIGEVKERTKKEKKTRREEREKENWEKERRRSETSSRMPKTPLALKAVIFLFAGVAALEHHLCTINDPAKVLIHTLLIHLVVPFHPQVLTQIVTADESVVSLMLVTEVARIFPTSLQGTASFTSRGGSICSRGGSSNVVVVGVDIAA